MRQVKSFSFHAPVVPYHVQHSVQFHEFCPEKLIQLSLVLKNFLFSEKVQPILIVQKSGVRKQVFTKFKIFEMKITKIEYCAPYHHA